MSRTGPFLVSALVLLGLAGWQGMPHCDPLELEQPGEKILLGPGGAGFENVFNGKDLSGWAGDLASYEVKDGAIVCRPKKGGNIFTKEEYGDFLARVEYRLPPGGNNGLAIRYPGKGRASADAMCEVQILDDEHPKYARLDPRQYNGSAYGMVAAQRGYLRPVGEWNFITASVPESREGVALVVAGRLHLAGRRRQGATLPPQVRVREHSPFQGVFTAGQRSGKGIMSVTISSPADFSSVPSVFTVSGTVDTSKEVPTVSGQAVSGNNTLTGVVTLAPTAQNPTFAVKFDASAFAGQGLNWVVTISAAYSGLTDKAQVHVTTP